MRKPTLNSVSNEKINLIQKILKTIFFVSLAFAIAAAITAATIIILAVSFPLSVPALVFLSMLTTVMSIVSVPGFLKVTESSGNELANLDSDDFFESTDNKKLIINFIYIVFISSAILALAATAVAVLIALFSISFPIALPSLVTIAFITTITFIISSLGIFTILKGENIYNRTNVSAALSNSENNLYDNVKMADSAPATSKNINIVSNSMRVYAFSFISLVATTFIAQQTGFIDVPQLFISILTVASVITITALVVSYINNSEPVHAEKSSLHVSSTSADCKKPRPAETTQHINDKPEQLSSDAKKPGI